MAYHICTVTSMVVTAVFWAASSVSTRGGKHNSDHARGGVAGRTRIFITHGNEYNRFISKYRNLSDEKRHQQGGQTSIHLRFEWVFINISGESFYGLPEMGVVKLDAYFWPFDLQHNTVRNDDLVQEV